MSVAPSALQLPVQTTLIALGIGAFAIGTDAFVAIGLVSEIAKDVGASQAIVGQIVSVFALTYAICAPIAATFMAKIDKKRVLLLATMLFILGNVICAVADGTLVIFLGRIVAALGAAIYTPQATAVASSIVKPEKRGAALAVVFGGMTVAGAVGSPLGTFIGQTFGWRMAFFAVAMVGVITLALLSYLLRPLKEQNNSTLLERLSPAKNRSVILVLIVTFFVVLSEYAAYSYISVILDGTELNALNVLPLVLALYGIGAIFGNLATAFLTDRFGSRIVLFVSVTLQTFCLITLILYRTDAYVVFAMAFAWGVFSYMYLVPVQHRLLELSKEYGAFTISLNSSIIYLGIGAGGVVGGLVVAFLPIEALAVVGAIASLLGIVAAVFAFDSPKAN